MDIYVARQPIFKKDKSIYAYELLFRDSMANYFPDIDGDVASSKVLSGSVITIGIDTITGGRRAFINFTQNLLIQKMPLMFSYEKIVVEMLENIEPEESLLNSCNEIKKKGYIIALDDFVYSSKSESFISLADIVKIDFLSSSHDEIKEYVKKLPKNIKLLAEKIETHKELKLAKDMGFEYFQGYFFCKPEVLHEREPSSSQMNLLQIMAEANKAEVEFQKIESLIAHDITISYKLLRYINTARFMIRREISSIKEALVYLGEKDLRRFISLIALSNLANKKPHELITTSCIRAKFCELLAGLSDTQINPWELFMLGLFSLIDAILDQPMESIMQKLPIADSIVNALVHKSGELSDYLDLACAHEKGNWDKSKEIVARLNIDESQLSALYSKACEWSNKFAL
ncbi:MAG: EAL and HDOD domain-containing protein [bacterium]